MTVAAQAPRVSVVMTAYNRADFIGAAIESVLGQTYTDFELIVVDDASTDETREISRRYLRDPRVRLEVNVRNRGDYPNRNHGARFARGEFLKYHDSDDVMYPDCLQVMVSALDAAPSAAFALTASRAWPGGPCPMLLTPELAYEREYLGEGLFHSGPASALFRTRAFFELGMFPECGLNSDSMFWMAACRSVNVVLVRADLFWYRVHEGQESSRSADRTERELLAFEAARWAALFDPACPLSPRTRGLARRNSVYGTLSRTFGDLRRGSPRRAVRRLMLSGITPTQWLTYLRRRVRWTPSGTPHPASG